MTSTTPLAYDDSASIRDMHGDARATVARLEQAARRVMAPAPSIHFEHRPRESAKRDIEVTAAAAALAEAIYGSD